MTSNERRGDEIHRHAILADMDRADAAMFRRLAAVPEADRPPFPDVPADVSQVDVEAVWAALAPDVLLGLAAIADDGAAIHDAAIRCLLAQPQRPTVIEPLENR